MDTAKDWGKAFYRKFNRDDAMGSAAEMAFRFMFALFPLLVFLAALSAYLARWLGIENPTEEILQQAGDRLPSDVQGVLEPQLREIFGNRNPGLITVTALTAIWAASSGTKTVMKTLNQVYEVDETRPFLRKQAVGVGLTIVGGLTFLAGAIVLVVGQALGEQIAEAVGLESAWAMAVTYGRIPVVLVLIAVAVGLVYWSAPNAGLPFRLVSWGAALFVVAWLGATIAFGYYVANFASYNATYGSLGAVIILMTWLYLSSLLLIVGAEVNYLMERGDTRGAEESVEAASIAERQDRALESVVRPRGAAGD
ncbi:MAG: YihY/virulence factor BrkB family protein [Dehalococcoidia bacterium]